MKVLALLFALFFSNIYAQTSFSGTYCETGITPYTSKNIFLGNGQYYGIVGLLDKSIYNKTTDTLYLNNERSKYSFVVGSWQYINGKKSIKMTLSDSVPIFNIFKDNTPNLKDSVTIYCKDIMGKLVKNFHLLKVINDSVVVKIFSDTISNSIKIKRNTVLYFNQFGKTEYVDVNSDFILQYNMPSALVPFVLAKPNHYQLKYFQTYQISKNTLTPNGKYRLYKCVF